MVWLAKWIREHVTDPRVLIITDRVELDEQIEKVFKGVNEDIYRTDSGADMIATLNSTKPWLICSLIHKFGSKQNGDDEGDADEFIAQLKKALPPDFKPKGLGAQVALPQSPILPNARKQYQKKLETQL